MQWTRPRMSPNYNFAFSGIIWACRFNAHNQHTTPLVNIKNGRVWWYSKIDQQIKGLLSSLMNWIPYPEPKRWEERTELWKVSSGLTCTPLHVHAHRHKQNKWILKFVLKGMGGCTGDGAGKHFKFSWNWLWAYNFSKICKLLFKYIKLENKKELWCKEKVLNER